MVKVKSIPYEIGIIFNGSNLLHHTYKEYPYKVDVDNCLKAMFLSTIRWMSDYIHDDSNLEYIESNNLILVFKLSNAEADTGFRDKLIFYGLFDKTKNAGKLSKKFCNKLKPLIKKFVKKYNRTNFTEIGQFEEFLPNLVQLYPIQQA